MKKTLKYTILFILLFSNVGLWAQFQSYAYKRELKNRTDTWQKVVLTPEILAKISPNISDIRIFGINQKNDTIEAPYLIHFNEDTTILTEVPFSLLNTSYNEKGFYFTFEIQSTETINTIHLDFVQQNFDWLLNLEGSNDQNSWFTMVEDYRILSIFNSQTEFQFTTIQFPNSKYRYYRIQIESNEKPLLQKASIKKETTSKGNMTNYPIKKMTEVEKKETQQTAIEVEMKRPVFINSIKILTKDTFDFYRPIQIQYASDSVHTEKGWKYQYSDVISGTFHSMGGNEFHFDRRKVSRLKVIIDNHDNQVLQIQNIEASGYIPELWVRFNEPAEYFVVYGNPTATSPNYDLKNFTQNKPKSLQTVELGEEMQIQSNQENTSSPLFENTIWLWLVMIIIIVLLAWFTLKMMKNF